MKYFFDTEFHEYAKKPLFGKPIQTVDLISIGMVDENGREFYAISKDFNFKDAWNSWQPRTGQGDRNNIELREYWLRENVLKPIFTDLLFKAAADKWFPYKKVRTEFTLKNLKTLINHYGASNMVIANSICAFIYDDDCGGSGMSAIEMARKYEVSDKSLEPEFYAYYADYDWVVFCQQLFGKMMDLPKGFPMYCKDLKQIMDDKALSYTRGGMTYSTSIKSAINLIKILPNYPKQENEHNALDDARWNYKLYKFLKNI